ncbi:hypothetical protein [Streptomyces sp. S063]|uniref:hypothetical protein n=1 Tax=Streptomyces sp. S063 TaxID=2005885 RepID=UPI001008150A|nr:hypothetical protein [Streptomyces sp. S063]
MTFVVAALVLVGALCVFDLLLTFAVLRRLREHTAELERLAGRPSFTPYDPGVLVGRALPESVAAHAPELVAFFDAQCDTCHEHAPGFAARARGRTALAVVSGEGRRAAELAAHVADDAVVLRDDVAADVVGAVGIEAFPTFLAVGPDGVVVRAHTDLAVLGEPAQAV